MCVCFKVFDSFIVIVAAWLLWYMGLVPCVCVDVDVSPAGDVSSARVTGVTGVTVVEVVVLQSCVVLVYV